MELHGTSPWNSMENIDAEISMEIGAIMISLEFHGKCPNPPCKYFLCKSTERFPWNSMEIDVMILHGIPWRIFHGNPRNSTDVFHTGSKKTVLKISLNPGLNLTIFLMDNKCFRTELVWKVKLQFIYKPT